GRLDVMIETGTVAFAQINGGTLRGLAVSSRRAYRAGCIPLEAHRRYQGHREVLAGGGPALPAASSMRVRLWPTESRPRLLRVCGIGANRDGDGAVVAQRLGHHFGMAVQPAQTGTIGGVENEVERHPP